MQVKTSASVLRPSGRDERENMPEFFALLIAAVILSLILFAAFQKIWPIQRVIVYEFQSGVKYKKGHFQSVLGSGSYWIAKRTTHVTIVDNRILLAPLLGQEMLSADGVPIKVSMIAGYQIVDPSAALHKVSDYHQAAHLLLQSALREAMSGARIDDILENRAGTSEKVLEKASPKLADFVLKLVSADIRDIMIPGELKKMFAQVTKAQKEGQAALEKARGESASLRSLANAARMLDDNPNLLQLRMVQALSESTGNTLVFGMPHSVMPISTNGERNRSTEKPEGNQES
jgi:regulator of protease activity HflC (stomatin/prohibitin superfamily)